MAAHAREHLGRAAVHAFVEGRREQREIEIRALARAAATAALAADCFRRRNAVVLGIVVSRVSSVGHVVARPRDGGQRATPPRVVPHPAAAATTARRAAALSDARAAASTASRRVARNARAAIRASICARSGSGLTPASVASSAAVHAAAGTPATAGAAGSTSGVRTAACRHPAERG